MGVRCPVETSATSLFIRRTPFSTDTCVGSEAHREEVTGSERSRQRAIENSTDLFPGGLYISLLATVCSRWTCSWDWQHEHMKNTTQWQAYWRVIWSLSLVVQIRYEILCLTLVAVRSVCFRRLVERINGQACAMKVNDAAVSRKKYAGNTRVTRAPAWNRFCKRLRKAVKRFKANHVQGNTIFSFSQRTYTEPAY